MNKPKSLNEKAQKLFRLLGFNHKQFSQKSEIPYATIHEFFNSEKNVTLSNFLKISSCLGVDIEKGFDDQINQVLNKENKNSQNVDDIALLINSLDKLQRKAVLTTAIHLNRLKNKTKIANVIERIEKKYLQ